MRIERVELDGFGRFREARWDLPEGITVLRGANEAGKTTLLNAVRALLFGFEATRDGRTWYPALAGGRRGGRLVLRTANGERWVVERHGERGGAGSLAVRAPNGNQGGQETLDRLLHGADRDLFNNIFAFGLGELQTFASLSADGVRGRIYGAGAGLGGTSAVDLERRLRQQLDAIHLPRGQRPLNVVLHRIEELRDRIAALERQPEEYEAAHRARAELRERADTLRAAIHERRERAARLGRVRAAAPVAAELAVVESELAAGDATLDAVPVDAAATLDQRLGALGRERATLAAIDEELETARAARAGLELDDAVLGVADEIEAVGEERALRAAADARRAELRAAEARHAAAVAEQLARAGGWEEARLLALDGSIPVVEAIRQHEGTMHSADRAAAEAEQRRRAAADELELRRRETIGPDAVDDATLAARQAALAALDELRLRQATAAATAGSGTVRPPRAVAMVLAAVAGAACLGVGAVAGAPLPGALVGLVAAAAILLLFRGASPPPTAVGTASLDDSRAEHLAALGLPPEASDAAVRAAADDLATHRARRRLAGEHEAALAARRTELERRDREATAAAEAAASARAAWASWLAERGLPDGLSPDGARQLLDVATLARRAAEERDHERAFLAEIERDEAASAARADALLAGLGIAAPADRARREALIVTVVERLDRSRAEQRRAVELDATIERLTGRRIPAAGAVAERERELEALLAAIGCRDEDGLRRRAAEADARRARQARARELRERLAGIAGSLDAIGPLVAAAVSGDLPALEAEQAELDDELVRLEADEREAFNGIGALDARIRELEAADELGLRRQELAGLEGRAGALAREWAVRAIALRLLEETRARYERERQPDVVRAAESYFERVTDGRYTRIVAPPGDATVRVETEGGEVRATEELSRGTAEQLYLALRFGLIEEFGRQAEPLPVVMDDILVNFDAARATRAAAAIAELAERNQVLYFTCHAWTAELLDPSGTRTVDLEAAATIG
jgi:uncharacterized protein YhaN